MRANRHISLTCFLVLEVLTAAASPAAAGESVAIEPRAAGLVAPVLATHAGDGSGRLFVVDQAGQIRIVDAGGTLLPAPFLDLSAKLVPLGAFGPGSFDERGLLGLAFHPDFTNNARFYVYYSAPQPPPDPLTFEFGDPIPPDVTIIGGTIGTQFIPPLYCSGTRALEIQSNQTATIEFDEPVVKVRFFLVHQTGDAAGTVEAIREDNTSAGMVTSNQQTVACDPNNFFEIEDFGFPPAIKRLELNAGAGVGFTLYLDDLEITRFNHLSRVSEFTVPLATPNEADPLSEKVILEVDQPQFNHNAGMIGFSPVDNLFYIALGDGGNAHDVAPFHTDGLGNAQDTTNLLGSLLRVDVDGDDFPGDPDRNYAIPAGNPFTAVASCSDGCDEIWAFGFRNPFRFSFDAGGTHRLFVGDAGQDLFEEVSVVSQGQNMGWNIKEGSSCFDPNSPLNPPAMCPDVGAGGEPLIDPILEYPHFEDPINMTGPIGQVVIGGFVYRGTEFPGLVGRYVFGDFSLPPFGVFPNEGTVFLGTESAPDVWSHEEVAISNGTDGRIKRFVMGFGQDEAGEVYICTNMTGTPFGATGEVFRIVASKGDMNADLLRNGSDVQSFVDVITGAVVDPTLQDRADMDGNGTPELLDAPLFVTALLTGC